MTTKYFIRTEESIEDAKASLERKQSVRRWAFFGCTPWEHLAFAIPKDEQIEILEELGYDITNNNIDTIIHNELFNIDRDKEIAKAANLTQLENGYYAEFLPGLCALESFDEQPTSEDCTEDSFKFKYLVCYEGEYIDNDPDEGWELFIPTKIVWTHDTGSTETREKNI